MNAPRAREAVEALLHQYLEHIKRSNVFDLDVHDRLVDIVNALDSDNPKLTRKIKADMKHFVALAQVEVSKHIADLAMMQLQAMRGLEVLI